METNNQNREKQDMPKLEKIGRSVMAVLKKVPAGVWLKLALVLIVVIIAVKLIVGVKKGLTNNNTTLPEITKNEKIDITPTLIRSIEQIGEWSFLEIDDEEMVDTLRRLSLIHI